MIGSVYMFFEVAGGDLHTTLPAATQQAKTLANRLGRMIKIHRVVTNRVDPQLLLDILNCDRSGLYREIELIQIVDPAEWAQKAHRAGITARFDA